MKNNNKLFILKFHIYFVPKVIDQIEAIARTECYNPHIIAASFELFLQLQPAWQQIKNENNIDWTTDLSTLISQLEQIEETNTCLQDIIKQNEEILE